MRTGAWQTQEDLSTLEWRALKHCLMLLQLLPNFASFFFDFMERWVEEKSWRSQLAQRL